MITGKGALLLPRIHYRLLVTSYVRLVESSDKLRVRSTGLWLDCYSSPDIAACKTSLKQSSAARISVQRFIRPT